MYDYTKHDAEQFSYDLKSLCTALGMSDEEILLYKVLSA